MNEYQIDVMSWFVDRFMSYTPKHFVIAKTPINNQSLLWIHTKLQGRFSYTPSESENFDSDIIPAFEDPQEAIFYELTWS